MVKEPFNISTEEEFQQLMDETDEELRSKQVKIAGRPIQGWLRISSRFGLGLRINCPERAPRGGCYSGDDLTLRIFTWFTQQYGDRIKMDLGAGQMVVCLRNDLYKVAFPRIWGSVSFMCSPQDLHEQDMSAVVIGKAAPPVVNILSCIEDMTPALASTLTGDQRTELLQLFVHLRFLSNNRCGKLA
jgi:hypothetical protein